MCFSALRSNDRKRAPHGVRRARSRQVDGPLERLAWRKTMPRQVA